MRFYLSPIFRLRSSRAHCTVHASTTGNSPFRSSQLFEYCNLRLGFCISYSTLFTMITRGACSWRILKNLKTQISVQSRKTGWPPSWLADCRPPGTMTQQGTRYMDELVRSEFWETISEKNKQETAVRVGVRVVDVYWVHRRKNLAVRPNRFRNPPPSLFLFFFFFTVVDVIQRLQIWWMYTLTTFLVVSCIFFLCIKISVQLSAVYRFSLLVLTLFSITFYKDTVPVSKKNYHDSRVEWEWRFALQTGITSCWRGCSCCSYHRRRFVPIDE